MPALRRVAPLQRLGTGERHMIGVLQAEMHQGGWHAPCPGQLVFLLGPGKVRALLDDRRRRDQLVDRIADFVRRHVGHAPGDLVQILPVVELAQEGDNVSTALEHVLGEEIAAEQGAAGAGIDERLR